MGTGNIGLPSSLAIRRCPVKKREIGLTRPSIETRSLGISRAKSCRLRDANHQKGLGGFASTQLLQRGNLQLGRDYLHMADGAHPVSTRLALERTALSAFVGRILQIHSSHRLLEHCLSAKSYSTCLHIEFPNTE